MSVKERERERERVCVKEVLGGKREEQGKGEIERRVQFCEGLPSHCVKRLLKVCSVHSFLTQYVSLFQRHRHCRPILSTLTAGDATTIQTPAQLGGGNNTSNEAYA